MCNLIEYNRGSTQLQSTEKKKNKWKKTPPTILCNFIMNFLKNIIIKRLNWIVKSASEKKLVAQTIKTWAKIAIMLNEWTKTKIGLKSEFIIIAWQTIKMLKRLFSLFTIFRVDSVWYWWQHNRHNQRKPNKSWWIKANWRVNFKNDRPESEKYCSQNEWIEIFFDNNEKSFFIIFDLLFTKTKRKHKHMCGLWCLDSEDVTY